MLPILQDLERCTGASFTSPCGSTSSAERFLPRNLAYDQEQKNYKQAPAKLLTFANKLSHTSSPSSSLLSYYFHYPLTDLGD